MIDVNLKISFTGEESKSVQRKGVHEDSIEKIIPQRIKDILRRNNVKYKSFSDDVVHNIGLFKREYYTMIRIEDIKDIDLNGIEETRINEKLKFFLNKVLKILNIEGVKNVTVDIDGQ